LRDEEVERTLNGAGLLLLRLKNDGNFDPVKMAVANQIYFCKIARQSKVKNYG